MWYLLAHRGYVHAYQKKGISVFMQNHHSMLLNWPNFCMVLNRTGVMCNMNSGLGWTLRVFLATFPTTSYILILQYNFLDQWMRSYAYQLVVSSYCQLFITASRHFWCDYVDIYRYNYGTYGKLRKPGLFSLSPSSLLCSVRISPLHVVTLEYIVAFYPLLQAPVLLEEWKIGPPVWICRRYVHI